MLIIHILLYCLLATLNNSYKFPLHSLTPKHFMPDCIACYKHFAREGHLNSHLRQAAKCRWVLEKRQSTAAGPLQTYTYEDDLEDDPNLSGEDIAEADADFWVDEDINMEGPNWQDANEDIPRDIDGDEPMAPEPVIERNDRRATVEDAVDEEPITTKTFKGAGKIIGRTQRAKNAASPSNPYHPFASKTDWEMAWWAKMRGPGQTSFNDMLQIDGVSWISFMSRYILI